jgi:outer membrane receptor for ferrienterochelin and colicin
MNMHYITRVFILLGLLYCCSCFSQSNFGMLGESGFAVDHKVNSRYSMNFASRSRYYLYQNSDTNLKKRQLDFVHFSTLKLDYNHSLSFGVQYRFREAFGDGNNELRLTQQFNYIKKNLALRFSHRFRFEQRILDDLTVFRSRYRFALDFPLNGEKLDVGESYLVTSMEALLSQSQKLKSEIDHRTTAQIGWLISKKLKLQIGLEYRFEAFNIETEELLFILTSATLKI